MNALEPRDWKAPATTPSKLDPVRSGPVLPMRAKYVRGLRRLTVVVETTTSSSHSKPDGKTRSGVVVVRVKSLSH